MTQNPNEPVVRNEVEATQASKSPKLIYVLVASLVLVIVAFAVGLLIMR